MFRLLWGFFTKSVRRQLIWGVVIVHAVLMSLFIWDVTVRQQDLLLEQQIDHANALSQSVSTSSAGWILSRDVIGLQEIIDAQSRYPELLYAMAVDKNGLILAHSDRQRRGQFVHDIPNEQKPTILHKTPELLDIVSPAIVSGNTVGWIRLGIGQHKSRKQLIEITRDGVAYAIVAILIGVVLASFMGTRLTRRLYAIQEIADEIEKEGGTESRAPEKGLDEAAQLAHQFNLMLDTLEKREEEIVDYNEALFQSESRFQRVLKGSNDGMWEWDIKTDDVYYSPQWKKMLGYDEDELEHKFSTWEALTHPDDVLKTKDIMQQYFDGNFDKFENEFRMRHKLGGWVHILARGELERDEAGNPSRLSGTHVDISERVNAEANLKQLADNIDEVFWLGSPEWDKFFYISPAYEKVWGRKMKDLYDNPQSWIAAIHPDDQTQVIKDIPEDMNNIDENIDFREYRIIKPQGEILWIKARAYPIRDPDGNVIRIAGIAENITERRHAENAMRKMNRRLADAQRLAHIGNWELDLETNKLDWSDETYKIFEIEKTKFGATYNEFLAAIHPDDRDKVNTAYAESVKNKVPYSISHRLKMADGRIKHVIERCNTIYDDRGKPVLSTGTVQDITEQHNMEEIIRRTQKMDAVGKLTGGVAHDFNNMLGVILGYSELLKNQIKGNLKLEKYLSEIHAAGERGSKLTSKLLGFSKQKSTDIELLNINDLIIERRDLLERTLTSRIKLLFDLTEDIWMVKIDVADIEDAIINICINAMHAIEDSGQLTIQTKNIHLNNLDAKQLQCKPGEYIEMSFTDTGSGMDEHTINKVFEPFFTTKGNLGTGLGLSQVYGFIERSNGVINIYSELNHGTKIVLYFPRYQQINSDDSIEDIDEAAILSGNETILVVDDEPALLELTHSILQYEGYDVYTAGHANQALEILKNHSIDLMISDVIMPDIDGYKLATLVTEKYPSIKIQLASGFTDNRHVNSTDESLHQNLLSKPYQAVTLLKKVRTLLDEDIAGT